MSSHSRLGTTSADRGTHRRRRHVVTPESSLLAPSVQERATSSADSSSNAHPALHIRRAATGYVEGNLQLSDQPPIPGGRVVAMATAGGPADTRSSLRPRRLRCGRQSLSSCRLRGRLRRRRHDDFPVKARGIACEQADAAAEMIAATIGVSNDPAPFHPVMRIQLLTGMFPRYLRLRRGRAATRSVPRLLGRRRRRLWVGTSRRSS